MNIEIKCDSHGVRVNTSLNDYSPMPVEVLGYTAQGHGFAVARIGEWNNRIELMIYGPQLDDLIAKLIAARSTMQTELAVAA